jgi:uncharacterized protein DUF6460
MIESPARRGAENPQMSNEVVNRFFGGPPLSVAVRIILLSILVGVILSAIGLDPRDIWRSVERLIRSIWDMGWDAIVWVWRYFLLGAVIVIPIWLVVRLAKGGRP